MEQVKFLDLLITAALTFCMYDWEAATQELIHILPSNHAADTSNCLNDFDCRTLNEWVENGTSPFTNDTMVVLLPGLHIINSTKGRLVTGNDSPEEWLTTTVGFIGEQGYSIVKCLHDFRFDFVNLKSVMISNISFTSCTLAVLYTIRSSTNISDVQQNETYTEHMDKQFWGRIFMPFITYGLKLGTSKLDSGVHILHVNFVDTSVKVDCDVEGLRVWLLVMKRVTFERVRGSLAAALSIKFVVDVIFTDIIFRKNTSPLIELVNCTRVVFEGNCIFHGNRAEWGTNITKVLFFILPKSRLEYSDNDVQYHLFHIDLEGDIVIQSVGHFIQVDIWSSIIVFLNNTVRSGGIFEIVCKIDMIIDHTNIIFRNNSGLKLIPPLFREYNAIMLIVGTSSTNITESVFSFSNNIAELSGGMTLVSCTLYLVGRVTFSFDFNQGQDGGAMAFYKKSKIYMKSNSNISIRFHHNRALKRGGGIFVEDSDYIDIITKYTLGSDVYIIHLPPNWSSQIIIEFSNNTAEFAGNQIYGGLIDLMFYGGTQILKLPKHDLNAIASNPIRICMCACTQFHFATSLNTM